MSLYSKRGVSAQKEEVHHATRFLNKGVYPDSFCKIFEDHLGHDSSFVNVMHADGAGTKSILAYLYWKETGDISIWKGIAQDAIVMNLDDLLCIGVYDNILFNSTIDRNKNRIPVEVLEEVISGTQQFFEEMKEHGIHIHFLGGETADVGDVVRTITVNGTMTARWPRNKLITNEKIKAGNLIIGLASYGQSTYETFYNSGIGSNGLTSARHDVLSRYYADNFKETYDDTLDDKVVYIGSQRFENGNDASLAKLLLSPTRTYAPVIKKLLETNFECINGLIHCSGGGQTKCMKYIPGNVRIIKDNLFEPPPVFHLIQRSSGADDREMYQVFNMGCRMEIYTDTDNVAAIIEVADSFGIAARIIGRVEPSEKKQLIIKNNDSEIVYDQ